MGLLGKLFSGKTEEARDEVDGAGAMEERTPVELDAVPPMNMLVEPESEPEPVMLEATDSGAETAGTEPLAGIRAYDQDGHEVIVPREEWSTVVLPGMVKEAWENPEHLYILILNSLSDGFVAEVTEAAAQLYATDPVVARGTCMWGIVLTLSGRLDEAEQVLTDFGRDHGEDGSVLVNLAKVYAARGDQERADATLWRALEVEPNLDNGLGWYASLAQERGGEQGAREAFERVVKLPGSWRAQLWLARGALHAGDLPAARQLYTEALERASRPVPPDMLMQMSGDLGGHGKLSELIEFCAPYFVPEIHGLPVGNNLMKANMDTGDLSAAEAILHSLAGFERPDWKEALGFWAAEIAKARGGTAAGAGAQMQIGMLRVDGPVWLPPGSPARGIFGAKAAGPSVTFLGGTAEAPLPPNRMEPQRADALGRLTRALPLFLAEQVEMRTGALGRTMLPWAVGAPAQPDGTVPQQPSGFVVSGARWPDEAAVQMVREPVNRSDYVVSVHVDAEVEPWTAQLGFVRTSDGVRIGELEAEFAPENIKDGLPGLADEVVALLGAMAPAQVPAAYVLPQGPSFEDYLLRLEQLLAVRCATMDGVPANFLRGEREVLDGELALCRREPENVAARLLLVETMGAMNKVRPAAALEFRERFDQMKAEIPLRAVDAYFA